MGGVQSQRPSRPVLTEGERGPQVRVCSQGATLSGLWWRGTVQRGASGRWVEFSRKRPSRPVLTEGERGPQVRVCSQGATLSGLWWRRTVQRGASGRWVEFRRRGPRGPVLTEVQPCQGCGGVERCRGDPLVDGWSLVAEAEQHHPLKRAFEQTRSFWHRKNPESWQEAAFPPYGAVTCRFAAGWQGTPAYGIISLLPEH